MSLLADSNQRAEILKGGSAKQSLQLLPLRHTKVVHFVRHGEGFHNLVGDYDNWDYVDAHLTEAGWQQARKLREHIQSLPDSLQLQAVVISPLTRAIETAIGAFGGGAWTSADSDKPLMLAQEAVKSKRAEHTAVSSAGCPPFIIHEGCREQLGKNPCDKRINIQELRMRYPAIDFTLVEDDDDVLWVPERRETNEELLQRSAAFAQWLMDRPESRLAVVTHSSFLYHLMANFGQQAAQPIADEMHRWYNNCEFRSLVLSDPSNGHDFPDPYHSLGNTPAAEKDIVIADHIC
ncbi:hypothetical protein WJX73_004066 [Symbiochloris irregularis]|uniref:Phosphoglycerate mutase-like protein n=1 Tax=Symbiochloris irregularis TaxID=706552 RepID=A0AAW1PIA9_9CHLO